MTQGTSPSTIATHRTARPARRAGVVSALVVLLSAALSPTSVRAEDTTAVAASATGTAPSDAPLTETPQADAAPTQVAPSEPAATTEGSEVPGADSATAGAPPTDAPAPSGYSLDDPPPQLRLAYQSLLALRVNPLGLLEFANLSARYRLFESTSAALRENYVGAGLALALSPAYTRIGALVEVQPATVLNLWARYEWAGYYGTFDLFQSFASANDDYRDSAIDARGALADGDVLRPYSTTGTMLTLGANVQLKVGPVAARNFFQIVRADFDLRAGDRVFYDQVFDLLIPNEGWMVSNDADLMWVSDFGLVAGARYTYSESFYQRRHFRDGEPDAHLNHPIHRLGPIVAYNFGKDPPGTLFNDPTLILLVNWYLEHRYRTGAETSAGLPYIALAFLFRGDLFVTARD